MMPMRIQCGDSTFCHCVCVCVWGVQMKFFCIVLTGGPSAGKTTACRQLFDCLRDHFSHVVDLHLLPEAAAALYRSSTSECTCNE